MQVEFFGIPRERVGLSAVVVDGDTLGHVLRTLGERFPAFTGLITDDRLHPSIAANLNGDVFISDPRTPLCEQDRLLILSADVGG